jgi:hypothetical protein
MWPKTLFQRAADALARRIADRTAEHTNNLLKPFYDDLKSFHDLLKPFHDLLKPFHDYRSLAGSILIEQEAARVRTEIAQRTPGNPAIHGFAVYSQCDEDGIIAHTLSKIETRSPLAKTCLEIGASDGLENNSHALILDGFRGVWVDGNKPCIQRLTDAIGGTEFPNLLILGMMVDTDNAISIVDRCRRFLGAELDVLSVDIDGNDIQILRLLVPNLLPKLVVAEYNAKFPPPMRIEMPYNPTHVWAEDDYSGVSLAQLVQDLQGYTLVSCNISGVNAFFVRSEFSDLFPQYAPSKLYQPLRRDLALPKGKNHPASLKFLKDAVRRDK